MINPICHYENAPVMKNLANLDDLGILKKSQKYVMKMLRLLLVLLLLPVKGDFNPSKAGGSGNIGETGPIFEDIYDSKAWQGHDSPENSSASGPGSDLSSPAVNETRVFVRHIIQHYIKPGPLLITDAACGDLKWIAHLLRDLVEDGRKKIRYEGFDIVDVAQRGALESLELDLATLDLTGKVHAEVSMLDLTLEHLPYRAELAIMKVNVPFQ